MSTLYVVDEDGTFCGAIDLKDLIIAREGTALSDITRESYPYVYAKALIDDCLSSLIDYSEASIPVLDNDNKLIGVVTAQDFMEVIDEEFGEDYAKLAGLTAEEDLSEPVLQSVKKRLPWLGILLVLGFFVSATVGLFETVVAQLPIIMSFQSLILGMAGNVGTQSLAVAIRVLMDQQIGSKHLIGLVWKETRVGILNGLLLGLLSFAAIGLYLMVSGNAALFAFSVSGCLGMAMVLAMLASSLSGTIIPILFKKLGVDPAVASGPLITTINDLVAVISYYGLTWLLLL
jgi:magnesium transporter